MPKLAYFPLYFDDFEHDTALLPDDDLRFKYLRLLWNAYQLHNALPADDATVARLAGIEKTKGWRKKAGLLRTFFDEQSGFLVHRRVGEELEKMAGNNVVRTPARVRAAGGKGTDSILHSQNHKEFSGNGGVDNGDGGDCLRLRDETLLEAERRYPDLDIEVAISDWREWTLGKGTVLEKPNSAFMAFCEKRDRRNR